LPGAPRDLLRHPRPDDAQPSRGRRGDAVPLRHLLPLRRAAASRRRGDRPARGEREVELAHRDAGRAVQSLLPRGGLPSPLLRKEPAAAVLPDGDRPESGEVPQGSRPPVEEALNPPYARPWRGG